MMRLIKEQMKFSLQVYLSALRLDSWLITYKRQQAGLSYIFNITKPKSSSLRRMYWQLNHPTICISFEWKSPLWECHEPLLLWINRAIGQNKNCCQVRGSTPFTLLPGTVAAKKTFSVNLTLGDFLFFRNIVLYTRLPGNARSSGCPLVISTLIYWDYVQFLFTYFHSSYQQIVYKGVCIHISMIIRFTNI